MWPKELDVSSPRFSMGNHVDLSQIASADSVAYCDVNHMDPDELEAEYARLVHTKKISTGINYIDPLAFADEKASPIRNPLDELRKVSVVSAVESNDDQGCDKIPSRRISAGTKMKTDAAAIQSADQLGEAETIVGTDPPALFSSDQSRSVENLTTQPTIRDGAPMKEKVRTEASRSQLLNVSGSSLRATGKKDLYIFVTNDARKAAFAPRLTGIGYKFSSIKQVVTGCFGEGTKLAKEAAVPATSNFKENTSSTGMNLGGCCVEVSP